MKCPFHHVILKCANGVERIIALAILIAAFGGFLALLWDTFHTLLSMPSSFSISSFLSSALLAVMGVEFVRMLVLHTTRAVIDVLLFAIARQMIVSHGEPIETLLGVSAVAGIFAIKKYLYVREEPNMEARWDETRPAA